jgi:hypothetical protein
MAIDIIWAVIFHANRAKTTPRDRMKPFTDAPVLDEDDRPKEEKGGVNDGIGIAEVVSYETKDGDEDEGMRVGSEKSKVESDGLTELVKG